VQQKWQDEWVVKLEIDTQFEFRSQCR